jgi:DNA-binding transcriptional MerR regulator
MDLDSAKLYYDINEVSDRFKVEVTTLRFWEKHFPMLKPMKKGGDRAYTPDDLEVVELIVRLVRVEGLKLKPALARIKSERARNQKIKQAVAQLSQVKLYLENLRDLIE